MRVGVVFPGDSSDPAVWSGIPAGLAGGLERTGVEVVHLRASPPRAVERGAGAVLSVRHLRRARAIDAGGAASLARTAARMGPSVAALRSAAASARTAREREADAFVQIGTGYLLATGRPVVTCEDMTIAQAQQQPGYVAWDAMAPRAAGARRRLQAAAYRRAVACGALSTWTARSIVDDYDVPDAKVHVMGIGANHLPPDGERDWSAPRFLFVGFDWERKRGDAVVRAFGALREQRPDATLDVVGGHPRLGLPGVREHGRLRLGHPGEAARLDALFAAATCFVMPSRVEPVGIVYAEALAAGIPSIGTTNGGSPLIIGDAGLTVDPGDEPGLLAAMLRLADGDEAARLGARARARSPSFRWEAVAERFLRALGHETWHGRELAAFL